MPFDATCPRALPYPDVVTSVPFTFRDGLTTLELIERLRHALIRLQSDVNKSGEHTQANLDSIQRELEGTASAMMDAMRALESDMRALVHDAVATGTAESPVRGVVQPVQTVIGDMYDNVRVFALFAADYDGMGLTAEEYDKMSINARLYDLHATDVYNAVLGDFTGIDDFNPANKQ